MLHARIKYCVQYGIAYIYLLRMRLRLLRPNEMFYISVVLLNSARAHSFGCCCICASERKRADDGHKFSRKTFPGEYDTNVFVVVADMASRRVRACVSACAPRYAHISELCS